MRAFALFIRLLARCLDAAGSACCSCAHLLDGLLPALLSPDRLIAWTRKIYRLHYSPGNIQKNTVFNQLGLGAWEQKVVSDYAITSGRILIMGSGLGREALAMARSGLSVIGVDINDAALETARSFALVAGVPVQFHKADYLALPYAAGSFDYALLSATMYSNIPGRAQRQAWLKDVGRVLKPDGLAIISFDCALLPRSSSRLRAFYRQLQHFMSKLPGANPAYQAGDNFNRGNFTHNSFRTRRNSGTN